METQLTYAEILGNSLKKGRVLDTSQLIDEIGLDITIKRKKVIIELDNKCPKCNTNEYAIKKGLRWLKDLRYNQIFLCKRCKSRFSRDYARKQIPLELKEHIMNLNDSNKSSREIRNDLILNNNVTISHTQIIKYIKEWE